MALLTKVGKVAAPVAGAVFIEPLLNLFAPSVKPLINQFIQSDELKKFLKDLVEGAAVAGSGACTNFLASHAEKLLEGLKPTPKLDKALIAALRRAFEDMRDSFRQMNQYGILNSFDQFFADWDDRLKQMQTDDVQMRELLEAKQFAHLFYELREVEVEEVAWWVPIEAQLEAWTRYGSIPLDLKAHLKKHLLLFAHNALTNTLSNEEYKGTWNEFQKSIGTKILGTLRDLETHIFQLKKLATVAGGQFIRDQRPIEFPLRKIVDSIIQDLSAKEIYIHRQAVIVEDQRITINGLKDMVSRDGYFLLAAPAGTGKSTLMARWLHEFVSTLQTSGQQLTTKLCYYFYSKQEGTSDHNKALTVLSDQLLKAHYIEANVNSFNPATIDSIIPNSLELDHPQRLLVVVDGLDEAGEPSTMTAFLGLFKRIFPRNLGKNTTVILTVRDDEGSNSLQHYRKQLHLPLVALEIPEVGTESLASYLSSTDDSRLQESARDADFLKRIIAKTEGLAIYVHYLLDELRQTDQPAWAKTIADLPKGFEEYVSASLPAALGNKSHWQDALFFLALTQSPLDERDLIALTEFSGHKLKSMDFDRVDWSIKRWLRSEDGIWSFSHQKIGEVFFKLYVENEKSTYIEYLLLYCSRWKQHESSYVLQNYPDLLQREGKEDDLYRLACDMDFLNLQKDKVIDDPNTALRTLQISMTCAAENDLAPMMAKFSLLHAKMVEEMAAESWVEAYSRRGFASALKLADNLSGDHRVIWYLQIVRELVDSNEKENAEIVLQKLNESPILKLSQQLYSITEDILTTLLQLPDFHLIKSIYTKALSESEFNAQFARASKYFLQTADWDRAKQSARSIRDPALRSQALGSVGSALLEVNVVEAKQLMDEAEQTVRSIENPYLFTQALTTLSSLSSHEYSDETKALLDKARNSARCIEDPAARSQALGSAGSALLDINLADAEQLLDEAEQAARSIENLESRLYALHKFAAHLAHPKLSDKAKRFVDSFVGFINHNSFLKTLSMRLADAGYFEQAEQVAISIKDSTVRSVALSNAVMGLINVGNFEDAERVADSLTVPSLHVNAIIKLAAALAIAERLDEAERLFGEAEQLAYSIRSYQNACIAFTELATILARLHYFDRASQLFDQAKQRANSIKSTQPRARALSRVTAAISNARYLDESQHVPSRVEDSKSRAQALMNLASTLAHTQRFDDAERLFEKAEQLINSIADSSSRFQALGALALALATAQRFDKAEHLARSIKDTRHNARALRDIAMALANTAHFDEAERVARSINSLQFRTQALGRIAEALYGAKSLTSAKHLYDETKQAVLFLKDRYVRSEILESVAVAFTDDQLLSEVEAASSIKNPWSRSHILRNISAALAKAKYFNESEQAANRIEDSKSHAQALIKLASALAHVQQFDVAERLFGEAEEHIRSIPDYNSRSQTLRTLALALVHVQPSNALRIAQELHGDNLLVVLDQLAKAKTVEGLKKYLISLSYNTTSALRGCAQMIALYDSQAGAIYSEIGHYVKADVPLNTVPQDHQQRTSRA